MSTPVLIIFVSVYQQLCNTYSHLFSKIIKKHRLKNSVIIVFLPFFLPPFLLHCRCVEMQYLRIYESPVGGVVDLHPLHGQNEFFNNFLAAQIIADHGYSVELLPELTDIEVEFRKIWMADVVGNKNPDVRINGYLIGDIKTPNPNVAIKKSTINHCIYSCSRQNVAIAIINLIGRHYTLQDIKKGIVGSLQPNRNKSIREVWIITRNKRIFRIDRSIVFDDTIYEALNLL